MSSKREIYQEIPALNFSRAKLLLRSPRAFHFDYVEDLETRTESLILGTLVHGVLLEGLDLARCIAIKPAGMKFNTTEGKAWRAAQTKPVVTQEECQAVYGMVNSLLDNKHARDILSTCTRREQIFTKLVHDVPCKALVDAIGCTDDGEDAVVELKTSLDCRAEFMSKRVLNEPFCYDLQAAWYRTLSTCRISCWVIVENKPPYDSAIYFPSDLIKNIGEIKMRKVLALYKKCTENDLWPGAQPDPMILDVPRWYNPPVLTLQEEKLLSLPDSQNQLPPAA